MMRVFCLLGVLLTANATLYLDERFDDENAWTRSTWKDDLGDITMDGTLHTNDLSRFYAIARPLTSPATTIDQDLVVSFDVKYDEASIDACGGAYVKLFQKGDLDLTSFGGETPFSIMFGPDRCGSTSRIHLLWEWKGDGLLKKTNIPLDPIDTNQHTYTLHLYANKTYTVSLDAVVRDQGSILHDNEWSFPSATIDDPSDQKPTDWVDDAMIPDPSDQKPDGWDEIPETIPDPEHLEAPDEWDPEDDGEWEPPQLPNPDYKGEWVQNTITNPDYKGEWVPKQLPNPDYTSEVAHYGVIDAVGFDLWIHKPTIHFDNLWIGTEPRLDPPDHDHDEL